MSPYSLARSSLLVLLILPTIQAQTQTEPLVNLLSDLNNDGLLNEADLTLRDAALSPAASPEALAAGTEFLLVNDDQSNGLWDLQEPGRPANQTIDDDTQELLTTVKATTGFVWFEHPALVRLRFYSTRECGSELKFPWDVSKRPLPERMWLRTEGEYPLPIRFPAASSLGKLVLRLGNSNGSTILAESGLRLRVVRGIGDDGHLEAVRDYISENNTTHYVKTMRLPGGMVTVALFLEEQVELRGINARLGNNGKGYKGIYELAGAPEWKDCQAIINCTYTFNGSDDGGFTLNHNGKLISKGIWDKSCSMDSTADPIPVPTHPKGYGTWKGQDPRYVISRERGQIEFAIKESECPPGAREGSGGFRPNHFFAKGVDFPFVMIGRVTCGGKNLLWVGVSDVSWNGNSNTFYHSLIRGSTDEIMFHGDPIGSICLAVANPDGTPQVRMTAGPRHGKQGLTPIPGFYLKTYLGINALRPRP